MLSDYIAVYIPKGNCFTVPHYELGDIKEFQPEPQVITLRNGVQFEGIPLMHFGTWGLLQLAMAKIKLGEYLKGFVEDPESIRECYRGPKIGEKAVKFFTELKKKYPEMVKMEEYKEDSDKGTGVPDYALVKKAS